MQLSTTMGLDRWVGRTFTKMMTVSWYSFRRQMLSLTISWTSWGKLSRQILSEISIYLQELLLKRKKAADWKKESSWLFQLESCQDKKWKWNLKVKVKLECESETWYWKWRLKVKVKVKLTSTSMLFSDSIRTAILASSALIKLCVSWISFNLKTEKEMKQISNQLTNC